MGIDAECTVRVGRKSSEGTAHLEGESLIFRGGFRLEYRFEDMREVSVEGDALVVKTDQQEARFEVGAPVAERWARLIKEPKSLFEKLEVGPLSRIAVVDVSDSLFVTALRERTASVAEGRVPEGAKTIFFGAETREALRKVALLRARMPDDGTLWIVRPKGSKAIGEKDVFDTIRGLSLVDTKVVSFSKTHTAHKCVVPVELRGVVRRPPPIMSIPPSAPAVGKRGSARAAKPIAKAKPGAPKRAAARPKPKKPTKKTTVHR